MSLVVAIRVLLSVLWAQKPIFSCLLGHLGETYTNQIGRDWHITLKMCKFVIKDTSSLRMKLHRQVVSQQTVWGTLDPSHGTGDGSSLRYNTKSDCSDSSWPALLNSQGISVQKTLTRATLETNFWPELISAHQSLPSPFSNFLPFLSHYCSDDLSPNYWFILIHSETHTERQHL